METITKTFKTNINCNNCLSKVSPKMSELEGIKSFEVDFTSEDRLMKVEATEAAMAQVSAAVAKAGFVANAE